MANEKIKSGYLDYFLLFKSYNHAKEKKYQKLYQKTKSFG
jgi:hypothetical protein